MPCNQEELEEKIKKQQVYSQNHFFFFVNCLVVCTVSTKTFNRLVLSLKNLTLDGAKKMEVTQRIKEKKKERGQYEKKEKGS